MLRHKDPSVARTVAKRHVIKAYHNGATPVSTLPSVPHKYMLYSWEEVIYIKLNESSQFVLSYPCPLCFFS
jgi:hypothetical protein